MASNFSTAPKDTDEIGKQQKKIAAARDEAPSDRIPPGGNGAYVAEKSGYFVRPK